MRRTGKTLLFLALLDLAEVADSQGLGPIVPISAGLKLRFNKYMVGGELRVVVAERAFTDSSPEGQTLARLHGRPLHFHARAALRPHEDYLAKHRAQFVG